METSNGTELPTTNPAAGADEGLIRLEAVLLDLPAVVDTFSQRLYDAGMSVTLAQSEQYVRALRLTKPASRPQLYFTTRAIFVTDLRQVTTFDRVFAVVFGSYDRTKDDHRRRRAQARPGAAHLKSVALEAALAAPRI